MANVKNGDCEFEIDLTGLTDYEIQNGIEKLFHKYTVRYDTKHGISGHNSTLTFPVFQERFKTFYENMTKEKAFSVLRKGIEYAKKSFEYYPNDQTFEQRVNFAELYFNQVSMELCNEITAQTDQIIEDNRKRMFWFPSDVESANKNHPDTNEQILYFKKRKDEYYTKHLVTPRKNISENYLSAIEARIDYLESLKVQQEPQNRISSVHKKGEKEPQLTLRQIALKYCYEGQSITKRDGEKLYQHYTKYLQPVSRTKTEDTKKKSQNKIKLIESVIAQLTNSQHKQKATDELNILKAATDKDFD